MFRNRRSIEDIKNMTWESDDQEKTHTVLTKIKRVDDTFGWYYIACDLCKKKVVEKDTSFWCNDCEKKPKQAVPRYRLQIDVADNSDCTTFIVFDREAEKLLGIPAFYLLEKEDSQCDDGPPIFKKIHGKRFIFQIRLNDYNLKDGFENYTVNRIFL